ncbi:MAG TPA: GH116 family glycosyl hydrolase [Prolixibacteraceae bacterium]|nr:GH116 family glycosyl hydrolase [Prolixibacteraceae bacterium]
MINKVLAFLCFTTFIAFSCCNQPKKDAPEPTSMHSFNDTYRENNLSRIAFPIGGIGAGMICMEGTGAFSHVSVRNTPEVYNEPLMFAAIAVKGKENGAKILEGPVPTWKYFGSPNTANGGERTSYGLPRFKNADFNARFPFATIHLTDQDIPVAVKITGWSPFIPGDPDNSSLPAGAIEYSFKNSGSSKIESVFSFNSVNFMKKGEGINAIQSITNGFVLSQKSDKKDLSNQGDFAIFTDQTSTVVDHCWFRGGWWDPLTMTWENIEQQKLNPVAPIANDAPGASLYVPLNLAPGEEKTIRILLSWYVPNSNIRLGEDPKTAAKCDPSSGCCASPYYQPWYSGKFANISEAAKYWSSNYNELKTKSQLFSDAFFRSTLPPEVLEAVSANLSILKSPTVLRQRDGKLWAWEGCSDNSGCCEGSCTHVWNYAQAIPNLFPSLERTLRNTEFTVSQNDEGHQAFRSALPIRPKIHDFYAASDGQLGGIMKVYREWRISGDSQWLKELFPKVKASMDYCINTWDPRHKGILEEPHHNTYDIEFWGPDGMCTSFYLGALLSVSQMGEFLKEDVSTYHTLLKSGKRFMQDSLYNGEYFYQKIKWQGLKAPNPIEMSKNMWNSNYSEEAQVLLKKEGPKYQYGKGCLSDGVLGFWLARMCGLENPMDSAMIKSHLDAVYKYNLKHDLSDHVNPQRPSYALGKEGGLLLCTWPKGGKLSLPFVYSNEVWTGIEYQVASHLILMGEVEKGLDIVRTCRNRYDGQVRNPFDEYECGHWYARAMSSYGLLQGLTGVRYDAVDHILYVDSKIGDFESFISTETGFGNVSLISGKASLNMVYGNLDVKKIIVSGAEQSL